MAQSKYETHVLSNLDKIIKWANDGATAKEIAKKLHVAYSTFKKYLDLGRRDRRVVCGDPSAQRVSCPDAE